MEFIVRRMGCGVKTLINGYAQTPCMEMSGMPVDAQEIRKTLQGNALSLHECEEI
jgi:hypothetical protein